MQICVAGDQDKKTGDMFKATYLVTSYALRELLNANNHNGDVRSHV